MNTITQQTQRARSLANYWRERYAVVTHKGRVKVVQGRRLNYQSFDELIAMVIPEASRTGRVTHPTPVWRMSATV